MTTETPTPYAGVPLRDHEVRFGVTPDDAAAAVRSQRLRFVEEMRGLAAADWQRPSRCSEWTVQGVVRHVVHLGTVMLDGVAAARAGERFDYFRSFDPKQTPVDHLAAAGDEPVAATLAAFSDTTDRLVAATDELAAERSDVLVATPVGRQPWHRAMLHGLFDSAVHERDVLAPLGRRVDAPAEETAAIAAYQVLLVGRILAVVGVAVDVGLRLTGGPDLRLRVDGPLVGVEVGGADAARVTATGPVESVLDAMVGRGSLAEVLDGPPEVVAGLSALSSLV